MDAEVKKKWLKTYRKQKNRDAHRVLNELFIKEQKKLKTPLGEGDESRIANTAYIAREVQKWAKIKVEDPRIKIGEDILGLGFVCDNRINGRWLSIKEIADLIKEQL